MASRKKRLLNQIPSPDELVETGLKSVTGGTVHKGLTLFYQCTKCNGVIPSLPDSEVECRCGNVFIEFGPYFRMGVFDEGTLRILRWTALKGK